MIGYELRNNFYGLKIDGSGNSERIRDMDKVFSELKKLEEKYGEDVLSRVCGHALVFDRHTDSQAVCLLLGFMETRKQKKYEDKLKQEFLNQVKKYKENIERITPKVKEQEEGGKELLWAVDNHFEFNGENGECFFIDYDTLNSYAEYYFDGDGKKMDFATWLIEEK